MWQGVGCEEAEGANVKLAGKVLCCECCGCEVLDDVQQSANDLPRGSSGLFTNCRRLGWDVSAKKLAEYQAQLQNTGHSFLSMVLGDSLVSRGSSVRVCQLQVRRRGGYRVKFGPYIQFGSCRNYVFTSP